MNNKKIKILLVFLIVFLCYIFVLPTHAFSPSGITYNGIDVSGFQGQIDFNKVKEDNIEIVYIKASEGSRICRFTF